MKKFLISLLIFFTFSSASFAGERINLAFNIDNNYITYFLLTVNSIFKNNKSDSEYYIYVIENDLTKRNKAKIEKFVEKNKHHVEFVKISNEKINTGQIHYNSDQYISEYITSIAFARIYLSELLPDLDRVLYLDSDILVLSDIKDLYDTDLSGYAMGLGIDLGYTLNLEEHKEELAKLEERIQKLKKPSPKTLKERNKLQKYIQSKEKTPYYNDGVALMDLKFIRKHHLMETMIDYAIKHPKLEYGDQDIINFSLHKYIKKLDPKWDNQYFNEYILTDISDGGIIHYIGKTKPWMTLPKKSCPVRFLYFQKWFASEFRFYMLKDICKSFYRITTTAYIECVKSSIAKIKGESDDPDKAQEIIHLAFNIDNNYATYFLLTVNSIFKNNKSDSKYYIYVVENDLSKRNKARIKKFIEKKKHHVEFVNISKEKLNVGKSYYYSGLPITNIAFARIYLPELLPNLDKVLYLDSDILVLSDIKDLYDTNLSGYAMGLISDFSYVYRLKSMKEDLEKAKESLKGSKATKKAKLEKIANLKYNIKIEETYPYYNDGIILMDLKMMRKNHLTKRMIDYAVKHPNLQYADQDVINNSMRPYIKKLDPKWNNQFYIGLTITDTSNGGIIHYISNVKPWMTLPKKSCPQRFWYFENWISSEFRFYIFRDLYKVFERPYLACIKTSIDKIKYEIGYPNKYQETIYVAFTIDNNYWLYTLLTINSIIKNNQSHSPYHFYVIEDNLSDKNKKKMERYVVKKWHQEIEFINIDTTCVDGGENLYAKTKLHQYISRIAMARIFLPDLLPKNVKKVLYLDSDLITTRDLKELYDLDISKYPVAMAKDIIEVVDKDRLAKIAKQTKTKRSTYYNDGVILMNLDYWRKHKITDQMVNYMKAKKYLPKMDQDLINIMLKGKVKNLKPYWNNQYCATNTETNKEPDALARKDGILHYIGSNKPWIYSDPYYTTLGLECRDIYSEYWTKSSLLPYQILPKFTQMKSAYIYYGRKFLLDLTFWDLEVRKPRKNIYTNFGQKCLVDMSLWNFEDIKR